MISYHAYTEPQTGESESAQAFTFFDQADQFLREVRYIEAIRQRLSPETRTTVDELGLPCRRILTKANLAMNSSRLAQATGTCPGILCIHLRALGQVGHRRRRRVAIVRVPHPIPSVSLVDWDTGKPNPRFWVLKLLRDNFAPGDKLVETSAPSPTIYAQAFITRAGKRKVLLVNKRNQPYALNVPGPRNPTSSTWIKPPDSSRRPKPTR